MRSSWRCSFSSSPDRRTPPSRLRLRSRVSRSRRWSSWSVAIAREEAKEPGHVRLELGPRDDRVDVAEAKVLLGEPEVLGELLARRLLDDARAGEGHQGAGLRDDHVAEAREAREHAGGRRMRHNADQRLAGVVEVLDGADGLRQLHQRQDPLLHPRHARRRDRHERNAALGRAVAGARELLADDAPHRAAHEGEIHDGELAGRPLDRGVADHHRLAEPGLHLGFRKALGVRAQVEELQRVFGAQLGRLLDERPLVHERCDSRARAHREVVAAVRTDPERRLELVVPVVRLALGTRVRMLFARRLWDVPVLDGDVDPGRHELSSLDSPHRRPSYSPRAAAKAESGSMFDGSKVSPVNPAPSTFVRPATSARIRSISARDGPPGSGMKTDISDGSSTSTSRATYVQPTPSSACATPSSPMGSPLARMNSSSGGSRFRAPTSATSEGSTAPESSSIRSGIPHWFPDGELSGVFRSPWASSQTRAIRPWRAASPSTAPTCEQQSPPSTSGRSGRPAASARFCSSSVSASTIAASGKGSSSQAASAMASPSSPQACGTRTIPEWKTRPHEWHS